MERVEQKFVLLMVMVIPRDVKVQNSFNKITGRERAREREREREKERERERKRERKKERERKKDTLLLFSLTTKDLRKRNDGDKY